MGDYTFAEMTAMLTLELEERTDIASHTSLGDLSGIWINAGYRMLTTKNRFWGLKRNFVFPELNTSASASTSDGVTYVALASDCIVPYHVFDETSKGKLTNISFKKYVRYTDRSTAASEDNPTEWCRYGSNIHLHPTPDATYSLTVYYRKRPALLTGSGVTVIGAEWDEVVLKTALILSLMKLGLREEAKLEKAEWKEMVADLIGIYDDEHKDREIQMQPNPEVSRGGYEYGK